MGKFRIRLFRRYAAAAEYDVAIETGTLFGHSTPCRLLGDLCRCALRALTRYFEVLNESSLTPGVITAIQTFGNRINLHPHLHDLVAEGGTDAAGIFHEIPRIDDSRLAEIFAGEVLAMLVRKELLNSGWAERICERMSRPHMLFGRLFLFRWN